MMKQVVFEAKMIATESSEVLSISAASGTANGARSERNGRKVELREVG